MLRDVDSQIRGDVVEDRGIPEGPDDERVLLTVPQVAARLAIKDSWVYSHAAQIGGYKLGKYWRFSWPRVLKAIEKLSASR